MTCKQAKRSNGKGHSQKTIGTQTLWLTSSPSLPLSLPLSLLPLSLLPLSALNREIFWAGSKEIVKENKLCLYMLLKTDGKKSAVVSLSLSETVVREKERKRPS